MDKQAASLDEAIAILKSTSGPVSVGLPGNAAELLAKILEISRTTQFRPALVTDQTSAHDPANGYLPEHWSLAKWKSLRKTEPEEVALSARESIAHHVRAIVGFKDMGIPCVDYGNNIRQEAKNAGLKNAFAYPGFVPAYVRPLFCVGKGPFRSAASPNRETESMRDGSDAISDWPLLNLMLNTASGATWVSFHHGGGVGMGYSQHAGMVIVCDGTDAAAKRIERVLWNDPASGVMRHADAGYEAALACAREQGLDLPMAK